MTFEQKPIKIEIPVEDEEVVLVAETQRPDVAQRLEGGARRVVGRAQDVWQSEKRQEAQGRVVKGVRHSARLSRVGLVRGLNWLSAKLAGVAERFTPVE